MTPKQQRFVEEYLIDLNATQAAIRAGYDWPNVGEEFYVYFLLSAGEIFYVGKGKGRRISSHRRERFNANATNQVKAARIRAAVEDDSFSEHVFASRMTEPDAMRLERDLIKALKNAGLTNISSGSVHPLESQIARINANLAMFRPFDEWDRIAPDHARRFAVERHGSMQGHYDWMVGQFTELRDEFSAKLNLIKGNHNV